MKTIVSLVSNRKKTTSGTEKSASLVAEHDLEPLWRFNMSKLMNYMHRQTKWLGAGGLRLYECMIGTKPRSLKVSR